MIIITGRAYSTFWIHPRISVNVAWKIFYNPKNRGKVSSFQPFCSKDATKEAFAAELIFDGDIWMEMIKSRNRTPIHAIKNSRRLFSLKFSAIMKMRSKWITVFKAYYSQLIQAIFSQHHWHKIDLSIHHKLATLDVTHISPRGKSILPNRAISDDLGYSIFWF